MKGSILDYIYITFIALVYGASFLFRTSLAPITDVISEEFGVNAADIGILSSCYFISYVLSQTPWGLYLQIFSCQSSLLISSFGLSIACLLFPFTSGSLAFGCAIFFFVGAVTGHAFTVSVIFAGKRFGTKYVNVVSGSVMIIGTAHNFAGNVIQSHIYSEYKVWKPTYWVLSGLAFVYGIVFLVCYIFEKKHEKAQEAETPHLARSRSISLVRQSTTAATVLKATFKQTIKMHQNWLLGLVAFCGGIIPIGVMSLWLEPYLMVKFEYSRSLSAIITGCGFFASGIGSVIVGVVSKHVKSRKLFVYVGCVLYFAFVALIYVDADDLPLPLVICLNIVAGLGFSCFCPFVFTICREYNAYYKNAETATGFVSMFVVASGFIGQFTIGALLDSHYEHRDGAMVNDEGNRVYIAEDFNFAFYIIPAFLGLGLIASFFLKETNSVIIDYGLAKVDTQEESDEESAMEAVTETELAETTGLNQEEE